MKTSYYAKLKNIDTTKYLPIAISGDEGKLVGFQGRAERKLSPYSFFKSWKARENEIEEMKDYISQNEYKRLKEENQDDYIEKFYNKVLKPLDPAEIYNFLGDNAVLLCFEKPTEFCHRFLVASWLEMELGVEIDELGFENDIAVKANKEHLKEKLKSVIEKTKDKEFE